MKLLFVLLTILIPCVLQSQTSSYNHPCILKSRHVKTERRYLLHGNNDTTLNRLDSYDTNYNRISYHSFLSTGERGYSDTLIYDSVQHLVQSIIYYPTGRIKSHSYYQTDRAGNTISMKAFDTKGKTIYEDTSVYDEKKKCIYTLQLTNNTDYAKMRKFFYNNEGVINLEIDYYGKHDSSIISYTYKGAAINDAAKTPGRDMDSTCKTVWLPSKIFTRNVKPKNDVREMTEDIFYYADGLFYKNNLSAVPDRNYLSFLMYYDFYE